MVMVYPTSECALAVVNKYTNQIVAMFKCNEKTKAKKVQGMNRDFKIRKVKLVGLM